MGHAPQVEAIFLTLHGTCGLQVGEVGPGELAQHSGTLAGGLGEILAAHRRNGGLELHFGEKRHFSKMALFQT